jgi:uncharacterized protein
MVFGCCAAATVMPMNGLAEEQAMPQNNPSADTGRFIDEHVHFHDCHTGDLDKVAEWMKTNHVQRCVNHPLKQSRPKNEEERKQMLENYARYKGRIDRFCIIFPDEVGSEKEAVKLLTREKQDGAIGFGEHYGGDGLKFDDPKNMWLYAACAKVGLPVMFHKDQNKNLDEKGLPRLENVLRTYPNCILIAHSDWWKNLADGTCDRLLQKFPNLYADISCTVSRSIIGRDKEFARAFFIRNADKLLFGTDSGWWSFGKQPVPEFSLIDDLHLPAEVVDKICRGNAERLFWGGEAGGGIDRAQKQKGPNMERSVKELRADFLKLKFGMFIHFNLETYKGVQWVSGYHSPADFSPGGKIDTDAWADAAVSAGMTYAVLTAKHVSGFCLWDSKYTTYDVMNPECPYKQDLVAQFIKSFKSRGLKVGLYYCWRHPGFNAEYKVLPPECDPATHSLTEQNEFQKKQIAELIEKYPDVFYLWNDGLDPKIMPAEEALAFVRSLRPDLLASSNWWDWGKKGTPYADIAVKEMRQFPETNTAPGKTCWCLEQGWFWKEGARPRTANQVMNLLRTVNSRNSNFLLNVGPNRQGRFEEASVQVLAEIGKLRMPDPGDFPAKEWLR